MTITMTSAEGAPSQSDVNEGGAQPTRHLRYRRTEGSVRLSIEICEDTSSESGHENDHEVFLESITDH
ncbi:hypothetical protein AMELA_G00073220 [Ameiurus melas]|uniref:Uncharacterized protein n=1 Tax=Ameiurus melas TaxID=219545 RepID=A0A7J6AXS9_AMEME|nr:hypothetical protein AMELA_G00073220 [Ameiurus melas]